jgi:hypothetical protein
MCPGENLPKFICDVSVAENTEITSAITWPVALTDTPLWALERNANRLNITIRQKNEFLSLLII